MNVSHTLQSVLKTRSLSLYLNGIPFCLMAGLLKDRFFSPQQEHQENVEAT
jgi:hypothetical protein